MELTLGSETSVFKTQTPGNNPEDYTLYSQHGESLKSTNSFPLIHQITRILINSKFHCCCNQAFSNSSCPQSDDLVFTLPSYLFNAHFNIILTITLRFFKRSLVYRFSINGLVCISVFYATDTYRALHASISNINQSVCYLLPTV
jgi:hypothetical protein